jgi:hypothetical protein
MLSVYRLLYFLTETRWHDKKTSVVVCWMTTMMKRNSIWSDHDPSVPRMNNNDNNELFDSNAVECLILWVGLRFLSHSQVPIASCAYIFNMPSIIIFPSGLCRYRHHTVALLMEQVHHLPFSRTAGGKTIQNAHYLLQRAQPRR